jgi:ribosomal protein S18 acetylase RimI-like enzyme
MSEIAIREYLPEKSQEDADLLLPAFLAIWNEPENLRFLSFTQKPFDELIVRAWFSNHLGLGGHYYAAVEKNKGISGIAVVRIKPIEGFEILGLGVRPESKQQGIGTRLLEHIVSVAVSYGFKAVDAGVFADNVAMLRLLLSMSFVPVSMDYNRRCDGADMLRMKRIL